jgi:ubiquinone/menaquinone biosynthesis C-methylase UbiE
MGDRQELLTPADTLAGFDRWSASYDVDLDPLVEATAWVLDRAPLGCADCDVVELGCGTGRIVSRALAEGARSYLGVDGSVGMLNMAAARTRDPRASFAHVDVLAPWTPHRTYDLALVVLVLEHLPTIDAIAQTLARVVRPGGRVRVIEQHPERIATGSLPHFREGQTEVMFTSFAHPVSMLTNVLETVGFETVRRDWLAADAMVAAVPRLGPMRGMRVLVDLKATRRR